MIPRIFIDRPIFAAVLSLAVTLAGGLAAGSLPVAQYPSVTPPTVQVDCNYPGASARVVSETIAAPIEQQVNGVEDMMYMSSQCTSDGTYTLTVTFNPGTDLNMAQVRVLNRVSLAMPQLPDVVRATGVTTRKRSPELLLTISFNSPDGTYDQLYLSNYASLHIKEELIRLPGISDVTIFGQRDYAMRVWAEPDRLAARNLSAADVVAALRAQNLSVVAGQVGRPPAGVAQAFQLTVGGLGRLVTEEQFGEVVVKVGADRQVVKVKDVARVELAARNSDVNSRFDLKPTTGLGVFLLSNANAVETAAAVHAKMEDLGRHFPPGTRWEVGYDTAPFIRESIKEVVLSLRDAIILVALVVLVFLRSWRAALIPLAAVPVAIVGTFAAMYLAGFSINNLTLFGLVLAVGIVVDDAIVVVEAVQHKLELGFAPREATIRAMDEVSGPVVAVGVVLAAVFIPCAFLSGIVGAFFRQFALTIAVSTVISTVNSLTLSPALAALLLKPKKARGPAARRWTRFIPWPFSFLTRSYVRLVGFGLRVPVLVLAGYAGLLAAGGYGYTQLPTGFIPQQDKGYLIASIQLPDAASAERTVEANQAIAQAAMDYEVEVDAREGEGGAAVVERDGRTVWVKKVRPVKHVNAIAGNSFVLSAYGSNFGSMFIILHDFTDRKDPKLYAARVAKELADRFAAKVPGAQVNVFGAPAVSGLGRAGGFRVMVEVRGDLGDPDATAKALEVQTKNLVDKANQQPQLNDLFTVYKTNSPQIFLDVDRAACLSRGVNLADVYATLQASMGSRYVNDFNRFGRTWQVNVQADPKARDQLEDIRKLKVRNNVGEMVPLAAVTAVREQAGPLVITRYNTYPAAAVNGNVAQGFSTGDARRVVERLAEQELPAQTMGFEWTELTYLEEKAGKAELRLPGGYAFRGDTSVLVFALSVSFVFLILAALYESWAFPLAVILVVPVCVASSLFAVWLTDPGSAAETLRVWGVTPDGLWGWGARLLDAGTWFDREVISAVSRRLTKMGIFKQDINIFTQVGFVVLVGLACKNAILIVEFAKVARDNGVELRTAVLEACALRFRPIIMTSVAFILGVVPLAVAKGAGAEMRQALGVAVMGGMIGVTAFGIVLTPIFFAVVDRLTRTRLFTHPWLRKLSDGALYALSFRYVRPLAGAAVAAAGAKVRKLARRKFGA
ncbi:MAG: efflux RND transporter permease subunit [Gemmataceae bacterium]|nr:efflux RND transporter permease subunit [Gemmataceae bacterium]